MAILHYCIQASYHTEKPWHRLVKPHIRNSNRLSEVQRLLPFSWANRLRHWECDSRRGTFHCSAGPCSPEHVVPPVSFSRHKWGLGQLAVLQWAGTTCLGQFQLLPRGWEPSVPAKYFSQLEEPGEPCMRWFENRVVMAMWGPLGQSRAGDNDVMSVIMHWAQPPASQAASPMELNGSGLDAQWKQKQLKVRRKKRCFSERLFICSLFCIQYQNQWIDVC